MVEKINLFDLFVTVGLKDEASDKVSTLSDKLSKGLATAAKVGGAAVTAAATGIGVLTKAAVKNYAEYEQLVGGVETLFKQNAITVKRYAENAYKNAGLSANEYMETVTSFSASLLQGLNGDTAKAARIANRAITDMSDNANKMGTSMEMIQNAYQGFAKQNYTMLDNLKLGYGGTAKEMARLINDSGVLGESFKVTEKTVNEVSFDKIIEAIGVVQDRMGITGTTAKEASETIAGSMAAAKSAWQNLVTGIADDNADFGQLVDNFVESVGTAANNIIPRIEVALTGAGKLVEELVPVIIEKVPDLVQNTLPSLLQSGLNMVLGIVQGITQNLPTLVAIGVDMLLTVIEGLIDAIPDLIDAIPEIVMAIVVTLGENAPKIFQAGAELLKAVTNGILSWIPKLVKNLPQILWAIVNTFASYYGALADVGANLIKGVWEGIKSMDSWLGDKISGFFGNIVDNVKDFLGIHSPSRVFAGIGKFMAEGLGEGWDDEFAHIRKGIESGLNFETNVTASGANSPRGGISPVTITVNINGGATPETGNEIGRRIATELRYRGVLAYE